MKKKAVISVLVIEYQMAYGQWNSWLRPIELKSHWELLIQQSGRAGDWGHKVQTVTLVLCGWSGGGGGDFFFRLPSQDTFQLNILCLARGIRGDSKNTGDFFKIISTWYFFLFFIFLSPFFLLAVPYGIFVSQLETEPGPLAVRAWNPNHWITNEFPGSVFRSMYKW